MKLTPEEYKKIEMLDKIFWGINFEDLKELSEKEEIIDRLRGTNQNKMIFRALFDESESTKSKTYTLEMEIMTLRDDIKVILKLLNEKYTQPSNWEWTNLKNKYSVY
jgi:hypothetical protein